MSSHPLFERPGSSRRRRTPEADDATPSPDGGDDALSNPGPTTDDTPTIISRNAPKSDASTPVPLTFAADPATGVRGRKLAHFELIEPIGVGGMAAVLRARDTQLDRFVALKILPPEMASDLENVRRFHQEARSAAKLDHENIARVFFCGEDQRLHFIAFEFVEGQNLRTILERRGRLPLVEAIHYMLQVAAGLAHASHRGVVHRDIKPSNIIITPNGRAKLVDMGLARSLEPRSDNDLTQSGVTLGTFDYISPEQALEPRDADVRSDIYSLGCTFYHVLTGRPSVPEGTAAKKLHHHQHVKPIDPRQYVPDLPVEVVQILDRMMAKNPRDRFQSPEQLVHQLLVLARMLGAAPEVPEGVLSVEASVPNPPSSRPLFWAGIAAVAVVVVVLALDQAPTGSNAPGPSGGSKPVVPEGVVGKGRASVAKGSDDRQPTKVVASGQETARFIWQDSSKVDDLVAWLEQQTASHIELQLAGEIDLSPLQGSRYRGLFVRATEKITLRPRGDTGQRVTLKFSYDGVTDPKDELVAVTLDAPETVVEGVRFIVDAHESEIQLTGLTLLGRRHDVRRCEFFQAQPSLHRDRPVTSLLARSDRARAELKLLDSVFVGFGKITTSADREAEKSMAVSDAEMGGQHAVVRKGPVRITAENCVFGPHAGAFRLEGDVPGDPVPLTVSNCSVFLSPGRSAAFDFAADATGKLVVTGCLFSRFPGEAEHGAVLVRQADDRAGVVFQGQDNGYHDLDGYWAVRDAWQKAGWKDFRRRLTGDSRDDSSRVIVSQPWEADPDRQRRLLEKEQFLTAFRLNLKLATLRRSGRPGADEIVGASKVLGESWLPRPLPRLDEKADPPSPRFLVVEPQDDSAATAGVYPNLASAVADARPGDTILLRQDGEMEIDPVLLGKKGLGDLTIRPARKYRPVLMLGESSDTETSLFRVYDGKLRLEGLEFRLRPGKRDFRAQSVVSLLGDGECVLKDCVATLHRSGETAVALAVLPEPGKAMRTEMPGGRTRDQGPKLILDNCFVRGEGDLLWTKANRPFALEVKDSLLALGGSVVNLEPASEATTPPASQEVRLTFERTTTYLGGHLVRLSTSKDPRGLLPTRCKAEYSLFLPATLGGKTLVQLEGPETDEKSLREKFSWKDGRQNAYGGYTSLLTQESSDGMAAPPMGMDKWKMLPGEDASTFNVKMERLPPATTPFTRMDPGQFKAPSVLDAGAPIKLPRP